MGIPTSQNGALRKRRDNIVIADPQRMVPCSAHARKRHASLRHCVTALLRYGKRHRITSNPTRMRGFSRLSQQPCPTQLRCSITPDP
ncbi:hypothetical protein GDO78_018581 [Eleutherodactylus coqui]|uniref:Uncharacterized protein n=1 Tax=Eleutherodactylus coqui TaxID=57060 RepID=A0A8J6BK94_ELECQ|nr:hypothetical protein GDO78_018581 [Eleutherodactylus coqui]